MSKYVVKEFQSDGYEDWCVKTTFFNTEVEAEVYADEVYAGFSEYEAYQAGQYVTVDVSN